MTINNVIFSGNLVEDVKILESKDGKNFASGKFGMWQGSDKESLFINFVAFNKVGEYLALNGKKGMEIIVTGSFSESKSIGANGIEYTNKNVYVKDAKLCLKFNKQESDEYVVNIEPDKNVTNNVINNSPTPTSTGW